MMLFRGILVQSGCLTSGGAARRRGRRPLTWSLPFYLQPDPGHQGRVYSEASFCVHVFIYRPEVLKKKVAVLRIKWVY